MRQVTQSQAAQLIAVITDQTTGIARDGLGQTDVQVEYRREGETSFTIKVLAPGDWIGLGNGVYQVSFTATELQTVGSFTFVVKGQPALTPAINLFVGQAQVVTSATSTAASLPVCTVTGNLLDASGSPVEGAGISARFIGSPVIVGGSASVGLSTESVGTQSDANGFFVLTLIRGGRFEVVIPDINYRRIMTVPASASASLFSIP